MDLKELNKPLAIQDVDFRIQSINNGGYATILAYKDARVDMNRLDAVVGCLNWKREHIVIDGSMYCRVSILNKETGEWIAYFAERPEGLPDGVLQGAPISYWHETRSDQLLQAVIEARNGKRELEEEEIKEIAEEFGLATVQEEEIEEKNLFQIALENKKATDQAALNKLTARVKRDLYNKSLAERRKKKKK
jgi:hypothetical protein